MPVPSPKIVVQNESGDIPKPKRQATFKSKKKDETPYKSMQDPTQEPTSPSLLAANRLASDEALPDKQGLQDSPRRITRLEVEIPKKADAETP